jgi:hypothetical protein
MQDRLARALVAARAPLSAFQFFSVSAFFLSTLNSQLSTLNHSRLRYLVATKARAVAQRKLRGL